MKPDPKKYDDLFNSFGVTYFFVSYWLDPEYLKRDFLIYYNHKTTEGKFFVSKRAWFLLSTFGVKFFKKNFPKWKKQVQEKAKETKRIFREIKRKNLSNFSDQKLREDFLAKIKFTQSLGSLYFFTEFFLQDKIGEMIRKDPKKNKILLQKVKEMQEIKFKLRSLLNKAWLEGNIFEKYLKEVEKRTKRKDLLSLHYQEIADLLQGKPIKRINRNQTDWVLGKFNQWQPIIGKKAQKIIKDFDKFLLSESAKKEFKGQVAKAGFYRGRVKIILMDLTRKKKILAKEIAKMQKGQVLVTSTTGPEMILACKKAGAIISEEGGICSHAAIVSRELKIPCIIGTKIATKVLKNGDLVEVDANKGIVKILKK